MKQQLFKFELTADGRGWTVSRRDNGAMVTEIALPADADKVRELALYGLKQVVADGAATSAEATSAERVEALLARAAAVASGEWVLRTGRGASAVFPDAGAYALLVRVGIIVDTPEKRAEWRALGPAGRAHVMAIPRVREAIAAHTDGDDGVDGVAEFVA